MDIVIFAVVVIYAYNVHRQAGRLNTLSRDVDLRLQQLDLNLRHLAKQQDEFQQHVAGIAMSVTASEAVPHEPVTTEAATVPLAADDPAAIAKASAVTTRSRCSR